MKIEARVRDIKKGPKKGVTVNLNEVKIARGVVLVDNDGTVRKGEEAPKQKKYSTEWSLPKKILVESAG